MRNTIQSYPPYSILLITLVALTLLMNACASGKKKPIGTNADQSEKEESTPEITKAVIKTIWVPDKIDESRWEEGHFLHLIDKPSTWKVK